MIGPRRTLPLISLRTLCWRLSMIVAYVRCRDGLEGECYFDELPRVGEDVVLRMKVEGLKPQLFCKVWKVEHYPTTAHSSMDRGVALYLEPVEPL